MIRNVMIEESFGVAIDFPWNSGPFAPCPPICTRTLKPLLASWNAATRRCCSGCAGMTRTSRFLVWFMTQGRTPVASSRFSINLTSCASRPFRPRRNCSICQRSWRIVLPTSGFPTLPEQKVPHCWRNSSFRLARSWTASVFRARPPTDKPARSNERTRIHATGPCQGSTYSHRVQVGQDWLNHPGGERRSKSPSSLRWRESAPPCDLGRDKIPKLPNHGRGFHRRLM